jgi:hypothetical protein
MANIAGSLRRRDSTRQRSPRHARRISVRPLRTSPGAARSGTSTAAVEDGNEREEEEDVAVGGEW